MRWAPTGSASTTSRGRTRSRGSTRKLLEGYLLDALERLDRETTAEEHLEKFLAAAAAGARSRRPSLGLGEDMHLRGEGVVGSGLELDSELIQLCAFSTDGDERAQPAGIMSPSRRR